MEQLSDIREQLLQLLIQIGFVDLISNENSQFNRVVAGVLTAAFYPSVAKARWVKNRALTKSKLTLLTGHNGKEEAALHPSSATHSMGSFESEWLVYHEKLRSTRVYIHDASLVTPFPLLLFGGREAAIEFQTRQLVVDKWMRFSMSPMVAGLFKRLRGGVEALLNQMLVSTNASDPESPTTEGDAVSASARDDSMLDLIVYLLKSEFKT